MKRLLASSRLVTLTGAGGVGKTRLALRVATDLVPHYRDGVWLVELAPLSDASLLPDAVAQALRLRGRRGHPTAELLREHLGPRSLLLVLDNCEHLVRACAQLAQELLRACPRLRVLATSREALSLLGEATFLVPSLSLSDPTHPAALAQSEAVRLFADRAAAALPAFRLADQNVGAVLQICRRLDGVPLAIELAAARAGVLSVAEIAARLDDRFRLLAAGNRAAVPRQQTLRATVDWSHDLLSPAERVLFRRLAVFAGGWTLDAAEVVCAGDGLEPADVLDLLAALAAKSLVLAEAQPAATRYRLLETLRQYAEERLKEAGEAAAVQRRHARFFLSLAEAAEPRLWGPEQVGWLDRLEREHDNLRAALRWCAEAGEAEVALRLAAALWRFWDVRGHLAEGSRWLQAVLQAAPAPTAAHAQALLGLGFLARDRGDHPGAVALAEQSLAVFRAAGHEQGAGRALAFLGDVVRASDPARSAALLEEALAALRAGGDELHAAYVLLNLALTSEARGDAWRVRALLEESLSLFRRLGDRTGIAWAVGMLGSLAASEGDDRRAEAFYAESLSNARAIGDRRVLAWIVGLLGDLERRAGRWEQAGAHLRESLSIARELGDAREIAENLGRLAALAHARGQHARAARLVGAADAVLERSGPSPPPAAPAGHAGLVAALRATLGAARFASQWEEGRARALETAVEDALAADVPAPRRGPAAPGGTRPGEAPLTRREAEVAALVARGLTNRQIAERLVLSERTVDAHLERIRGRLGVRSRAEIAAWAVEQGLTSTDPG